MKRLLVAKCVFAGCVFGQGGGHSGEDIYVPPQESPFYSTRAALWRVHVPLTLLVLRRIVCVEGAYLLSPSVGVGAVVGGALSPDALARFTFWWWSEFGSNPDALNFAKVYLKSAGYSKGGNPVAGLSFLFSTQGLLQDNPPERYFQVRILRYKNRFSISEGLVRDAGIADSLEGGISTMEASILDISMIFGSVTGKIAGKKGFAFGINFFWGLGTMILIYPRVTVEDKTYLDQSGYEYTKKIAYISQEKKISLLPYSPMGINLVFSF